MYSKCKETKARKATSFHSGSCNLSKKKKERGISSTTHKQKCILTPTQSFVFGMSLITLGSRFSNALPT